MLTSLFSRRVAAIVALFARRAEAALSAILLLFVFVRAIFGSNCWTFVLSCGLWLALRSKYGRW
jgi:hypothetical protein